MVVAPGGDVTPVRWIDLHGLLKGAHGRAGRASLRSNAPTTPGAAILRSRGRSPPTSRPVAWLVQQPDRRHPQRRWQGSRSTTTNDIAASRDGPLRADDGQAGETNPNASGLLVLISPAELDAICTMLQEAGDRQDTVTPLEAWHEKLNGGVKTGTAPEQEEPR